MTEADGLPDLCHSQYGMCGHCRQLGNHEHCTTRRVGPVTQPITWITRGTTALAQVWTVEGGTCAWICSCPCPKTGPLDGQLDLFADMEVAA